MTEANRVPLGRGKCCQPLVLAERFCAFKTMRQALSGVPTVSAFKRFFVGMGILGLTACSEPLPPTPSMLASVQVTGDAGQVVSARNTAFERAGPNTPTTVNVLRYKNESGDLSLGFTTLKLADDVELRVRDEFGYDLNLDVGIDVDRPTTVSKAGTRYELIISNTSPNAYELVSTVDGVDVISGREGNDASLGYLILAGETLVINGVYKNRHEVIPLRFAAVSPTGESTRVGIIRLALFAGPGVVQKTAE